MQWIQRLITDADRSGAVKVAPPILSRAFQEFGRGMVNLNNVRKIEEIPIPFPYHQMITIGLLMQWILAPFMAAQIVEHWWWAGITCTVLTGCYWAVMYISLQLDQPFGSDHNDLHVSEMQKDFNISLLELLNPLAQAPPTYTHRASIFGTRVSSEMHLSSARNSARKAREDAQNAFWLTKKKQKKRKNRYSTGRADTPPSGHPDEASPAAASASQEGDVGEHRNEADKRSLSFDQEPSNQVKSQGETYMADEDDAWPVAQEAEAARARQEDPARTIESSRESRKDLRGTQSCGSAHNGQTSVKTYEDANSAAS